MRSEQARLAFLKFFEDNGHTVVPSSSLVPSDASVMFTIAGMIQFAPYFLGTTQPPFKRATSAQKCLRAGGKQNDLEEVGPSPRHHTFFEMLGNFSFGDYFKSDACRLAWELSTGIYGLDADRLWVSVSEEDDEAADIWTNEVGLSASRVVRLGREENFWSMGGAGPCGSITELFYDFGPAFGDEHPTGPKGGDENRYREFYNLVFMQFVQNDKDEIVGELEHPGVDTGMGFERMLSVIQGVSSNYETDVFEPLIAAAEKLTGASRDGEFSELRLLRILADHARALTFLIADGVMPSNEGRGYVLRRIMRRAITNARLSGVNESLLAPMSSAVVAQFGNVYPELIRNAQAVVEIATREEERFGKTLDAGLSILTDEISRAEGEVSGEVAFRLHDTYGFPLEITQDVAQGLSVTVDVDGFNELMAEQKNRSRTHRKETVSSGAGADSGLQSQFLGYAELSGTSKVAELSSGEGPVKELHEGQTGEVVLPETVFYPEGGGQIGDTGFISSVSARARVIDTKRRGGSIVHSVAIEGGTLTVGDDVSLIVDEHRRQALQSAHTATHILHFHLRDVLGTHVRQMGSLVEPGRLRFDFAHFDAVGDDVLVELEEKLNQSVEASDLVDTYEMPFQAAVNDLGAMAFFEEKYGDVVRVVDVGGYSRELCGGTHVARSGEIGYVKITSEGSIGSNIRRVEALCGIEGLRWVNSRLLELSRAAEILKVNPTAVSEGAVRLAQTQKDLTKRLTELESASASVIADELIAAAASDGLRVVAARRDVDAAILRDLAMKLRDRVDVVVLGRADASSANLVVASLKVDSRDVIAEAAAAIGGKPGGKANLSMCGGREVAELDKALDIARVKAEQLLAQS